MAEKIQNLITTIFLGIFCSVIFLNINSPAQSQGLRVKSHLQFNKQFEGKVFVLDGDSIRVGKNEVRLYEIDAPEYKQTCFDAKKKEYACGQVSRDFLLSLAGGKKVECFYAIKDKYDRFLSKCFLNGISINEEIIKNGHAVIYDFSAADEKMIQLENEAKAKKLGVWKGAFQLPKDYRKAHPRPSTTR